MQNDTPGRQTSRNTMQRERPDIAMAGPEAARIYSMMRKGYTPDQIASETKISRGRIKDICKLLKIDFSPAVIPKQKPSVKEALSDRDRRIKELIDLGWNNEQIGHEVGLTRERVRQIREGMGYYPVTEQVSRRRILLAKASIPFFQKGVPRTKMAEILGVSVQDINDLCAAAKHKDDRFFLQLRAAIERGRKLRKDHRRPTDIEDRERRERIQIAFLSSGLTSGEIERKLGWKYLKAHHIVHGRRKKVNPETAQLLAKALGVSHEWLVTGSNPPDHLARYKTADEFLADDACVFRGILSLGESRGMNASRLRRELGVESYRWMRIKSGKALANPFVSRAISIFGLSRDQMIELGRNYVPPEEKDDDQPT